MQCNSLRHHWLAAVGVAGLTLGLGSGCSTEDPAGPTGDPRLSTPGLAHDALKNEYGELNPDWDFILSMHSPSFRFVPADPESIPFLEPGETEWDFSWEQEILSRMLIPGRTSWIDQILLETVREQLYTTENGRVVWEAKTDLTITSGGQTLVSGRSLIDFVYEQDALGNYVLVEQVERPYPKSTVTVGQIKSMVASPPTITALDPVSVGLNNAVLQAQFNANGLDTDYWFEWGTDTTYGSTTDVRAMGSGTIDETLEITITPLASGTIYHYRPVARSLWGTSRGEDRSFTTLTP